MAGTGEEVERLDITRMAGSRLLMFDVCRLGNGRTIRTPTRNLEQLRGLALPVACRNVALLRCFRGGRRMIRVYLIDDHEMVRTGFRMVLEGVTDIVIAGESGSAEEALPQVQKLKPDVVLCDLHLPGLSGLDVTERIVRGGWGAKVIVVSAQEDGPLPRRLIEAGASGYLGKAGDAQELLKAIREVARGRRYLSSGVAQALAFANLEPEASPFTKLTQREMQIAKLLVQGLRMSAIADKLNLSPKTVSTHKYNLMEKLGVSDMPSLTRLALKHGLLVDGV